MQSQGTPRSGALSGLRVLELGSTVAAPFCGRLLADFGAEVVKVEPFEGDTVRTMGRHRDGDSLYAASILRNKRLIAIDLSKEKGRSIVRQLARISDVLIENFRPGRLEHWGLGYEALAESNPGLVMVRISGYGQTGPYRSRPGYGVTCEAVSGLRELTGDPDRPPARVAVSLTDEVTALYAAFGALMALLRRQQTGRGQVVDAALYEAAFSLIEPHVPAYGALGVVATRAGARLPDNAPNNLYPSNDGGFVHITAITNPLFERLTQAIGAPELSRDARFAEASGRARNQETLDSVITDWTRQLSTREIEERLVKAEIPAARIYRLNDIFQDPHFREREMLVELEDHRGESVVVPGVVPKLSDDPGEIRHPGGPPGADTSPVLRDLLGITQGEVDELVAAGVVHQATAS
jgi:crotonobetainyl-CoA:carnitine CoA-transferase CaiB-like acyl-CoA transferase